MSSRSTLQACICMFVCLFMFCAFAVKYVCMYSNKMHLFCCLFGLERLFLCASALFLANSLDQFYYSFVLLEFCCCLNLYGRPRLLVLIIVYNGLQVLLRSILRSGVRAFIWSSYNWFIMDIFRLLLLSIFCHNHSYHYCRHYCVQWAASIITLYSNTPSDLLLLQTFTKYFQKSID